PGALGQTYPSAQRAAHLQRRIEADAQHRALRQIDLLAFGRGNRAAATDEDASERSLAAAQDAADDRADAGAGTNLHRVTLVALAFEHLSDHSAHRIRPVVECHLIEADGHRRLAIETSGRSNGGYDPA